jgi:hypothetical protein
MELKRNHPDTAEITGSDVQTRISELRGAWAGDHSKSQGLDRLAVLEGNLQAGISPDVVMNEVDSLIRVFGTPATGGFEQESY